MVIVAISDLKFALKVASDQLLQLTFLKYMVIPMIDCSLLVFRFNGSLDKGRVTFDFLLFNTRLLIFVLQVPSYEHILGLKHFFLLLISPHIYEPSPSYPKDSMHLCESSDPECPG